MFKERNKPTTPAMERQFELALLRCYNRYCSEITEDNIHLELSEDPPFCEHEKLESLGNILWDKRDTLDNKLIEKAEILLTAVNMCYNATPAVSISNQQFSPLEKAADHIQKNRKTLDEKRSGTLKTLMEMVVKTADKLLGICTGVGLARRLSGETTVGFFGSKISTQGHDAVSAAELVLPQAQAGA